MIFQLWDRLFKSLPDKNLGISDIDPVIYSMNSTSGALIDTLIAVILERDKLDESIANEITTRIEKLNNLPDKEGLYSKVCLTASIETLFKRFPIWVKGQMIPFLDWSNPIAIHCWSTLNYVNWIGNLDLLKIVKKPFIKSFKQTTLKDEELNLFVKSWSICLLGIN